MKLSNIYHTLLLSSLTSATPSPNAQSPLTPTNHHPGSLPLLPLHKSLCEIESITGNEHAVATYLTKYLRSINFTVELQPCEPWKNSTKPRENILAYLGKKRQTRILVSSHIDTVPPYWPYERDGDVIRGRGSVDAKGSVATQIKAVEALIADKTIEEGDVAFLFVVGEEVGGDGMKKANDLGLTWESAIFGEPTELKLASGHKGIISVDIRAQGKAGHSGYPKSGKSANAMMIPALYKLLTAEYPYSEKYGNTTINIGKMEGGVAANVLAEEASAKIAIRIADGPAEDIEKLVRSVLKETGEEFELQFHYGYGPVYIDSDVPGFETIVVNYGTDIPNLKGDHKRYLYGPGSILEAHSAHEHLSVKDLEEAVEGYKKLIKFSLGKKD